MSNKIVTVIFLLAFISLGLCIGKHAINIVHNEKYKIHMHPDGSMTVEDKTNAKR